MDLFAKGFALGLSIAAPVGPIALLCIRRTLTAGRASGWATGPGAATADGIYGTLSALGVSVIANLLLDQSHWLRLFGGAFLCYLGIRTLLAAPVQANGERSTAGLSQSYVSGLLLTLANPITILSFAALFASAGVGGAGQAGRGAAWIVIGTFAGSAAWWLLLAAATERLRGQLDERWLRWLNRFSGLLLFAFGLSSIWALI